MKIDTSLLVLIATVFTFGMLILMMFQPIPEKNIQIMLAFGSFVLGYFFGSSVKKPTPPGNQP